MIWGRCSRPKGWVALGCWLLVDSSGGLWAIKGAPTTESEVVEYLEGIRTRADALDFHQFEEHFCQVKAPNQEEFLPNREIFKTYFMLTRSDGRQLMPCEEWVTTYLYLKHERNRNSKKKQQCFNLRYLFERLELINNNKLRNISFLENEQPFLLNYYVDKIQAIQALLAAYKQGSYDAWLNQPTEDGSQGEASPTKAAANLLRGEENLNRPQSGENQGLGLIQNELTDEAITDSESDNKPPEDELSAIMGMLDESFDDISRLLQSEDWKAVFGGIDIPENLIQHTADSVSAENKNLQEETAPRRRLQDARITDKKLHLGSDPQSEEEEEEFEEEEEAFEEEESEFEEEDYPPSTVPLTAAGATCLPPDSGAGPTGGGRSSLTIGGNAPILTEISTNKEQNDDKKNEGKKPDQK